MQIHLTVCLKRKSGTRRMYHYESADVVNFAVASSAIKHTIRGDANITDDVEAIRNLMDMKFDIKR